MTGPSIKLFSYRRADLNTPTVSTTLEAVAEWSDDD